MRLYLAVLVLGFYLLPATFAKPPNSPQLTDLYGFDEPTLILNEVDAAPAVVGLDPDDDTAQAATAVGSENGASAAQARGFVNSTGSAKLPLAREQRDRIASKQKRRAELRRRLRERRKRLAKRYKKLMEKRKKNRKKLEKLRHERHHNHGTLLKSSASATSKGTTTAVAVAPGNGNPKRRRHGKKFRSKKGEGRHWWRAPWWRHFGRRNRERKNEHRRNRRSDVKGKTTRRSNDADEMEEVFLSDPEDDGNEASVPSADLSESVRHKSHQKKQTKPVKKKKNCAPKGKKGRSNGMKKAPPPKGKPHYQKQRSAPRNAGPRRPMPPRKPMKPNVQINPPRKPKKPRLPMKPRSPNKPYTRKDPKWPRNDNPRRGCHMKRKRCGVSCMTKKGKSGKCKVHVTIPKMCNRTVQKLGICPGSKHPMCSTVEEEKALCNRMKTTKVRCPEETYDCTKEYLAKRPCPPDKCDKWKKTKCKKKRIKKKIPCPKPRKPCKNCKEGVYFEKCKKKKWVKVQVPCPVIPIPDPPTVPSPSMSPSSSPVPSASPSASISMSSSPSASSSSSGSPTPSSSRTPSASPIPSSSRTPSSSPAPSSSRTPSSSPAPSSSHSPSPSLSSSPSSRVSPSSSNSPSISASPSPCYENSHPGYPPHDGYPMDSYPEDPYSLDDHNFDYGPVSPLPMPFPDQGPLVAPLRCFASFFEESECTNVVAACKIMSDSFDEEGCTATACQKCDNLDGQKISSELQSYCETFRGQYCLPDSIRTQLGSSMKDAELRAGFRTSVVFPKKKCFKKVLKTVESKCPKKLPPGEKCIMGCRTKPCFHHYHSYAGPCKYKLPSWCAKRKPRYCKFRKKTSAKCKRPGKVECESKVRETYVCKRKKVVKKPCAKRPRRGIFGKLLDKFEKKCKKAFKEKYICGSTMQTKFMSCSHKATRVCKPKFCNVKVCKW